MRIIEIFNVHFLIKSSSARHSMFVLMLALCCLSSALGAKIIKKVVSAEQNNNEHKDGAGAKEPAPAAEAASNEHNDGDGDADDDDDDDDNEEEEETVAKVEADKETASTADHKNPNAVQTSDPTDLSVWGMVRSLWSWLRSDLSESLFGGDDDDDDDDKNKPATVAAVEGRTFGKIRRLQMALIPIIFKFGVLSAMVAFLVAIGMKSLFLLKVLVLMNAIAILGKFITLKSSLFGQYEHTAPSFNYPGWNPHAKESNWGTTGLSGSPPHPPSKEIHLHIHGNAQTQAQLAGGYNYEMQGVGGGWASRSDPYGAYAPSTSGQYLDSAPSNANGIGELPNNTDPMALLPTKYPARNLIR
ncbi:uncharacterized protein LOC6651989 [Drosophila willistoni]|uniref:uncharacterized protein LOC6651989 n=1 Tax=Drosophila willistoni TaxID=7260 RepID=UPI001F07C21D|nr:uncharacterized protein LOC6651989 [Drosophila willistoni]